MNLFHDILNHVIAFVTDKEKVELAVSYLKFFVEARAAVTGPKKEKTSDKKKSKVKSESKNNFKA